MTLWWLIAISLLLGMVAFGIWLYEEQKTSLSIQPTPERPTKEVMAHKLSFEPALNAKATSQTKGDRAQTKLSEATQAATFTDSLKSFSAGDQKYLRHFNAITFGLLDFSSREDYAWKISRGYPSAEQLLINRNKPLPTDAAHYREGPLEEAVINAVRIAVAIQQTKDSNELGKEYPRDPSMVIALVAGRIGSENPQSTSLAGYLMALSESVSDSKWETNSLVMGATLASQSGDPGLAYSVSRFNAKDEYPLLDPRVQVALTQVFNASVLERTWHTRAGTYVGRPFDGR